MEKLKTIEDAARHWVSQFNAIPQALILKAYPSLEEDGLEILATELVCANCGGTDYTVNEDDEKVCDHCQSVDEMQDTWDLPMWRTMWTFGENIDEGWARDNLETMRDCGFWVYESDELGVVFGINGAGYDFYEDHWVPLYKARGLHWHK
jgi:hypothetical protein